MYRRPAILIILFVAVTAGLFMLAGALKHSATPADARPIIAVTSRPLYDAAVNVAGDDFRVVQVLPPGANPHTFEPTPSSVRALTGASVVFALGHGIDDWIDRLTSETGVPKTIVDTGITLRKPPTTYQEPGQVDDEFASGADPHYWLTPANARIIASNISADLETRFPDKAPALRGNLKGYQDALDATDAKVRDILSSVQNRKIVTLHDAWYYFADAYGLEIVGTFEPTAGREPTPRYLDALAKAVAAAGVHTLYAEPGLSLSSLDAFTRDHGLTVVTLDPDEGASDMPYTELITHDAETIRDNQ